MCISFVVFSVPHIMYSLCIVCELRNASQKQVQVSCTEDRPYKSSSYQNIQSGPKKCIHSLLINIFGINLNEISVSGWQCNIMFSQVYTLKDISASQERLCHLLSKNYKSACAISWENIILHSHPEIEISFKFIPKIFMSKECKHFLGHSVYPSVAEQKSKIWIFVTI